MKFLQIVLLVICLFSCTNEAVKIEKENKISKTEESQTIQLNEPKLDQKEFSNNGLTQTDIIEMNDYSLKIKNQDAKDKIEHQDFLFETNVLTQEMIFSHKNEVINKIKYPVKFNNVKTQSNENIRIQENKIYELSVIKGKKDWFYKVSGVGVISSQSEFCGAYSPSGKLLWYSYYTHRNSGKAYKDDPNEAYGDFDKLLAFYGLTESQFNKPEKSVEILF